MEFQISHGVCWSMLLEVPLLNLIIDKLVWVSPPYSQTIRATLPERHAIRFNYRSNSNLSSLADVQHLFL